MSAYVIRPGRVGDHPFVLDSWLGGNKSTPRAREMLSLGIYWTEYKATIRRLLESNRLLVACDPHEEDAILGWACVSEPPPHNADPLVYYVYVRGGRHGARRCGIASALLAEFLPHACTYTHRPAKGSIAIPDGWFFNPERNYR